MAGIKGPCPKCKNPIEAPHPEGSPPAPELASAAPVQASQPEISAPTEIPQAPSGPSATTPLPKSPLGGPTPFPEPPWSEPEPIPTPIANAPAPNNPFPDFPEADPLPAAPATADPMAASSPQSEPSRAAGFPEPEPLPRRASDSFPDPAPAQPSQAPKFPNPDFPPPELAALDPPTPVPAPAPEIQDPLAGIPSEAPSPANPVGSPLGSFELGAAPGTTTPVPTPGADPLAMGPPPPISPAGIPPPPGIAPLPDLGSPGSSLPDLGSPGLSMPIPGGPSSPTSFAEPFAPQAPTLPPGFEASPEPGEPNPSNTLPFSPNDPIPSTLAPLGKPARESTPPKTESHRRLRWPGIVFPLLFLVLAAIMVYLVLDLSELLPHSKNYRQLPEVPKRQQPAPSPANAEVRARAHTTNPNPLIKTEHLPVRPIPPVSDPPLPTVEKRPLIEEQDRKVEGEVGLPPLIDLSNSGAQPSTLPKPTKPDDVLRKFLGATTLAERRPYMTESRRSEAALASGPLASALPDVVRLRSIHYMEDPSDKRTEHFFEVSFNLADTISFPVLFQLNEWGDGQIKVHTDAFLDLYNDEMAVFGHAPVEGEHTFHVVADAYKHCFDERIPDAAKKSFIKLRAHPQFTPRLKAYFGSDSQLAEQIARPNGLPWGSSGVCTVTVKWNTSTPDLPFVELVRIDGFTWNP